MKFANRFHMSRHNHISMVGGYQIENTRSFEKNTFFITKGKNMVEQIEESMDGFLNTVSSINIYEFWNS